MTTSIGFLIKTLDVFQELVLVDTDQRDRRAFGTGATGPADAMNIVLRHVRQLEVDDIRQFVDIDAARRDVGGHQDVQLAALEVGERSGAGVLTLVTVDRVCPDTGLQQFFRRGRWRPTWSA